MTACLHCAINELISDHIRAAGEPYDVAEVAAMIAQSLGEFILTAPKADQGALLADSITTLGATFLDTSGEEDGERPLRAH